MVRVAYCILINRACVIILLIMHTNACHKKYVCYAFTMTTGDTDSLFVHVPGRSKDEAIALGTSPLPLPYVLDLNLT